MVDYRRNVIPGGCYFFTVTLLDRNSRLLADRSAGLCDAFRTVRAQRPFTMDAVIVLPLPPGDVDYALRWREIKSRFSRRITAGERRSRGRVNKGERGIWQRRYWEHSLRDERDVERHIEYIHCNPVKHGHVHRVAQWPYSSFHRFARKSVYPMDWAGGGIDVEGWFGA